MSLTQDPSTTPMPATSSVTPLVNSFNNKKLLEEDLSGTLETQKSPQSVPHQGLRKTLRSYIQRLKQFLGSLQDQHFPPNLVSLLQNTPPDLPPRTILFNSKSPSILLQETQPNHRVGMLTIPGVPNGLGPFLEPFGQNGLIYYNPFDSLQVLHNVMQAGKKSGDPSPEILFEQTNWPKEHPHSWLGQKGYNNPLALIVYHVGYCLSPKYRKEILKNAVTCIREHLKHSPTLVIWAHSYGTIVGMDAIAQLSDEEAKRIIFCGFGQSYRPILYKLSPIGPFIGDERIESLKARTKACFFARVKGDALSAPLPPKHRKGEENFFYEEYPAEWWENGINGHMTVTNREDVMGDYAKFLAKILQIND